MQTMLLDSSSYCWAASCLVSSLMLQILVPGNRCSWPCGCRHAWHSLDCCKAFTALGWPHARTQNNGTCIFWKTKNCKIKQFTSTKTKQCVMPCHVVARFIMWDALLSDLMQGSNGESRTSNGGCAWSSLDGQTWLQACTFCQALWAVWDELCC